MFVVPSETETSPRVQRIDELSTNLLTEVTQIDATKKVFPRLDASIYHIGVSRSPQRLVYTPALWGPAWARVHATPKLPAPTFGNGNMRVIQRSKAVL